MVVVVVVDICFVDILAQIIIIDFFFRDLHKLFVKTY